MKLLYLAHIRFPTEKAHGLQIMKMCESFQKQGLDVTLFVSKKNNPLADVEPFQYYDIKTRFTIVSVEIPDLITYGPMGFYLESLIFALHARRYAREHKADILFSRDEVPLSFIKGTQSKIIWESHGGSINRAAKKLGTRADTIIVLTNASRNWYVNQHGMSENKIIVAPDAIDLSDFAHPETKEASRARLGIPRDKPVALYIGRVDGWKGVRTFLDAAALVPEVFCGVIGGDEEQVMKLRAEYSHVHFFGYRPYTELADNQAAADVLVLPNTGKEIISVLFTSPLKLFSYMASKRPIVASDLPSIREVLDEKYATLVAPDDAGALAEGIKDVLANSEVAQTRARNAFEKVQQYTWDARAKTILEKIS